MEFVKVTIEDSIATMTVNRPECLNALNNQVYRELESSLEALQDNDAVKVIILTGAGDKAFVAGADISQMVQQNAKDARALSVLCHKVSDLLENVRQVTIAMVNGYALGGGCELTLACDLRIASERARFGLPEVGLGIMPAAGGTQRLAQIVGTGRAKELIFTGDPINAQEAFRMGLANHVVPHEELRDFTMALAKKIASRGSFAVSMAKRAVNASLSLDRKSGMDLEEDLFSLLFTTHDKQEGMEAFLARRKPTFTDF